jgi:hypothetical protein
MTYKRLAVSVGKLSSVWRMNGRYASIFDGRGGGPTRGYGHLGAACSVASRLPSSPSI